MAQNASNPPILVAILASGSGSNAAAIVQYFEGHNFIQIAGIWTNKAQAGVVQRDLGVPVHVFTPGAHDAEVLAHWQQLGVRSVALAGYLKAVPLLWIEAFSGQMFNVHPALLPKFGGAGMYGLHIHRAVVAAGESRSGLTIHEVSEHYDEGPIRFQCEVDVLPGDQPEDLQARILRAEHWAFPRVLEALLLNQDLPNPSQCPA